LFTSPLALSVHREGKQKSSFILFAPFLACGAMAGDGVIPTHARSLGFVGSVDKYSTDRVRKGELRG